MKQKTKILFTLPNLNSGGAERIIVNIINSLDENYFDIHLLLINNSGSLCSFLKRNIKITTLNVKKTRYALFALIKQIKKINPDIIFSTLQRMNLLVLIASFFISKKIKIFVREPTMPSLFIKSKNTLYLYLIIKLYPRAFMVIAQSNEMKKDIINSYNINKEKIRVINNPLDKKSIDKMVNINKDIPFLSRNINVVASGNINKYKDYGMLIHAFKLVIEKNNSFHLYILGRDEKNGLKESLEQLLDKLNIKENVHFLGYQENPYIFYKYSDLFVLSSKQEGLPNVILENLYLEKPIISTNCINSINKLLINRQNGFIVNVGDFEDMADKILRYKELKPYNSYTYENINKIMKEYV